MEQAPSGATTTGALLGGRVRFEQPVAGYRAAIDPVLLAATVPATAREALDLGAGAGAATLCLAARCPALPIRAIEIDPAMAALARRNAAANGLTGRVEVTEGDIVLASPATIGRFDAVFFNPPYQTARRASPSPDPGRRRANVEHGSDLAGWIDAARRVLRPRGQLRLVHRADRLHEIVALLATRFGDIAILPLWPRAGAPARRILVGARLGARGGARLLPGLVLHGEDGGFTADAEAVLRHGAGLDDAFRLRPGG
jgi:tRNA1(Val) A37 N6-methylase TrmN6